MPRPARKPRSAFACRWCTRRMNSSAYVPLSSGMKIPTGVCFACYYAKTRPTGADPRFKLWAESFVRAKETGLPHELEIRDVPTAAKCSDTGVTLVHEWVNHLRPATPTHAVLAPTDPAKGYVAGNVRCVSRAAAGLSVEPAGNLADVGGE